MLSDAERDAFDNIARATRFVDGLDFDAFLADDKTFYAATRCLEIISEASRRLAQDRQRTPRHRETTAETQGAIGGKPDRRAAGCP